METGVGGGPVSVDLNENEEAISGGDGGKEAAVVAALKAYRAGVSGGGGGQEAGKGQLCVTAGDRADVNTAPALLQGGSTWEQRNDVMLDLDKCLADRLTESCVISGICADHTGLNGFLESPGQEEVEEREEETGEEGGGGGMEAEEESGLGLDALCSAKTSDPDLDDIIGEIWDPHVDSPFPDAFHDLPNGDVGNGCSPATTEHTQTAWKSCDEMKLANGGLHILRTSDSGDMELGQSRDFSTLTEDALNSEICYNSSITSAILNCPIPEHDVNHDSALSEEDEDISELSLPIRPQTLRTNLNLSVSLSCDATPLSPDEEEAGFYYGEEGYGSEDFRSALEAGRRQSAPDKLPDLIGQSDGQDPKLMPKRFGIADFFTRSLFSRKPKEPKAASHNATGWRLFSKAPVKDSDPTKHADDAPPQEEQQKEPSGTPSSQSSSSSARRKNLEFEPLSTTALILEDRPSNLPAKSMEETQRHKQEYEEMVAGAKRRELKEAQRKKLQMKERHRQEDSISNAMVVWNTEILPHWDSMKGTRRVRELWWQGLPPSVRGRVWSLAIGNELNITPELYEIFLSRAKEKWRSYSETSSVNDSESEGASLADRESSLDLIKLDISRTFPSLFIFQKGGPYHDLLHSVLGAYTCYRPDIGYVQGMSFIAAVLILNLEEADAFITFANLLNKPCQMAFFRVDHELMLKYFAAFEVFFEENLPRLFNHFQSNNLTPDLYLIDWIFTLYSKSLPLDVACRVWDVFCRDGEESLFRTGLGILRLYQDILLQMDFIHIAQFLTRLPEDLHAHTLFHAMANTHMISRNRRWTQVFSALMKDGGKETDRNSSPALRS
ncbi:TBC1 domain family member 12 isoform X2 [Boleophthalmus pectinirostris]|uniref:TBC1 domain family member 12 isoform X2 n=1 Tax=Boleophthalmus pectinirostris TaxID=150288 RepID=UPI00242C3D66|nr:TBC1 domain family member 12 isoform X2 [Boleophthalmus pectinirostris]